MIEIVMKVAAGAIAGGVAGLLLSRARTCSAEQCKARGNLIYYTLAGAFFGAAVAFWLATKQ